MMPILIGVIAVFIVIIVGAIQMGLLTSSASQFILHNGSQPLTGNWNVGGYNMSNLAILNFPYASIDFTTDPVASIIYFNSSYFELHSGTIDVASTSEILLDPTNNLFQLQGNDLWIQTDRKAFFRDFQIYITSIDDGHLDVEADQYIDMNAPVTFPDGIYGDVHKNSGYLRFSDVQQLQFRDNAIYLASLTDGHLDIEADTSIDLNANTDVQGGTLDVYAPVDTWAFTVRTETGGGHEAVFYHATSSHADHFAKIDFIRTRGTIASRQNTNNGDSIGALFFKNYGDGFRDGAFIKAVNSEATTSSSSSANLQFATTPTGATYPVIRWTLYGSGSSLFSSGASNQFQIRDSSIYLASLDDGHLDLEADISIDLNSPVFVDSTLTFDTSDYIDYDEANDHYLFYIGGSVIGYIDATGFHDGSPP